ncbi:VOC family protein [Kribbella sp. NPDC050820]|uniref:VOC family protein n=1 Tax=Kribbella sp. NPDC050820 TaxID=3155408 RepID=UPI0033DEAC54
MRSNRSMPVDVLIPVLGYPDVSEAVEWLTAAFGFRLRWQIADHRAQLAVGPTAGLAIVQSDPSASAQDEMMVRVDDIDAHILISRANGAEITQEPTNHKYGERQYVARDHAGRTWCFSESIEDLTPESWGASEGPGLQS